MNYFQHVAADGDKNKNENNKMKNHPFSPIHNVRDLIKKIRAARSNRGITCILGQGFVLTLAGSHRCFTECEFGGKKGYNFSGQWDDCVRYTREDAEEIMNNIEVPYDIEVVHVNEARDRLEAESAKLLNYYWTNRKSFRDAVKKWKQLNH